MSAAQQARQASVPATEEEVSAPAGDNGDVGLDQTSHKRRFKQMEAIFKAQPRVKIRLPKDEVRGDQLVTINGYSFYIQRGVQVEVPQGVYDVLEQAGLV